MEVLKRIGLGIVVIAICFAIGAVFLVGTRYVGIVVAPLVGVEFDPTPVLGNLVGNQFMFGLGVYFAIVVIGLFIVCAHAIGDVMLGSKSTIEWDGDY